MRPSGAVLVLAALLFAAPSWAAKSSPQATFGGFLNLYPASEGGPAAARTNINKKAFQKTSGVVNFPQGRNNAVRNTKVSVPAELKPKKSICVGNDCGCVAGR